jgi:hypothetical protein
MGATLKRWAAAALAWLIGGYAITEDWLDEVDYELLYGGAA